MSAMRDIGDVAVDGVFRVGVFFAAGVDAGEALDVREERVAHACAVLTKVRAMLSGTTDTKKR